MRYEIHHHRGAHRHRHRRVAVFATAFGGLCAATQTRAQPAWSIDPRPRLEISGQVTPEGTVLRSALSGVLTPGGRLVVADSVLGRVFVFGRGGQIIANLGNSGHGPDRFGTIAWMGRCGGDSILVWDARARRMTYFTPEGERVRADAAPFPSDSAARLAAIACSRQGTFATVDAARQLCIAMPSVAARDTHTRRIPIDELLPQLSTAVVRAADITVAVGPGGVFLSEQLADSVRVFTVDGRVARAIASVPVRHDAQPRLRRLDLDVDANDLLWVSSFAEHDSVTRVSVLSPSGRALAQLALPHRGTVLQVGADFVVASYRDVTRLPHVVVYPLTRGSRSGNTNQ
jgi:hypothetical protein